MPSDILSGTISGISSALLFFMTFCLIFFLAFYLACLLARGWGSGGEHRPPELQVEVRRGTLPAGAAG